MVTTAEKRCVLSVRIDTGLRDKLRDYKFFTGISINDAVENLISEFFDGPGRDAINSGLDSTRERNQ